MAEWQGLVADDALMMTSTLWARGRCVSVPWSILLILLSKSPTVTVTVSHEVQPPTKANYFKSNEIETQIRVESAQPQSRSKNSPDDDLVGGRGVGGCSVATSGCCGP